MLVVKMVVDAHGMPEASESSVRLFLPFPELPPVARYALVRDEAFLFWATGRRS
jgi:hypothetical protein